MIERLCFWEVNRDIEVLGYRNQDRIINQVIHFCYLDTVDTFIVEDGLQTCKIRKRKGYGQNTPSQNEEKKITK